LLNVDRALPQAGSADAGSEGSAAQRLQTRRAEPQPPVREDQGVDLLEQAGSEWEQLADLASQARLELRLDPVPKSNVVVMRFVDPDTGEVVREFPPEQLAKALTEIRALAASHLDRKA
jgi:uncharacterized FlaG/YvyC family protein